jgi:hypothetical protein
MLEHDAALFGVDPFSGIFNVKPVLEWPNPNGYIWATVINSVPEQIPRRNFE